MDFPFLTPKPRGRGVKRGMPRINHLLARSISNRVSSARSRLNLTVPQTPAKYVSAWGIVSSDSFIRERTSVVTPGQDGQSSCTQTVTTIRRVPACPVLTAKGYYQFGLPPTPGPPPPLTPKSAKFTSENVPWELMSDIGVPLFSPTRHFGKSCAFRGPRVYRDRLTKMIRVENDIPLPLKGVDLKSLSVREIIDMIVAEKKKNDPLVTQPKPKNEKTIVPHLNQQVVKRAKNLPKGLID